MEQGELTASLLDKVGSKEESLNLGVQSSLDASGRLRITREKKKSKLPINSEELRAKLKLEGNTLIMLGAKFRNRAWFQNLTPGLWFAGAKGCHRRDAATQPTLVDIAAL